MIGTRFAQVAVAAVAALLSAPALGLDETYQGVLQPDTRDPQIPIVVRIRDVGNYVEGSVTTSAPYKGGGPIASGNYVFGKCEISVVLTATASLRMYGTCDPNSYAGSYFVLDKSKKTRVWGTFSLARKAQAADGAEAVAGGSGLANNSACLKANTKCLVACPRGDESVELLCSNRCRAKLQTCKLQAKKTVTPSEAN